MKCPKGVETNYSLDQPYCLGCPKYMVDCGGVEEGVI